MCPVLPVVILIFLVAHFNMSQYFLLEIAKNISNRIQKFYKWDFKILSCLRILAWMGDIT